MSDEYVDELGKILIRQVRDQAILDWRMILAGEMKDRPSQVIRDRVRVLVTFSPTLVQRQG